MPDLTQHTFKINGSTQELHDLGLEPVGLSVRWSSGGTLTLLQARNHHRAALQPGTEVAYYADAALQFKGIVRNRDRTTSDDSIVYHVDDALRRAGDVSVHIQGGVEYSGFTLPAAPTVGEAINAALIQTGLNPGAGFDEVTEDAEVNSNFAVLGGEASLSGGFNGTLAELIALLMPKEPEYRLIVRYEPDGTERIDAKRVFGSGLVYDLQWGGQADTTEDLVGRVADVSLTESIDGTWTAVKLVYGDTESGSREIDKEAILTPAWSSGRESTWSVEKLGKTNATDAALPTDLQSADDAVYRVWRIPTTASGFDPKAGWKLMVNLTPRRRYGLLNAKWVAIEAQFVELGEEGSSTPLRLVVAKHPITVAGNVHVPGKAKGPGSAKLVYRREIGGGLQSMSVRVPSTGFEGSAYAFYNVRNERRFDAVQREKVTIENAQALLDAGKDAKRTGSISVFGRMPEWAWAGGGSVRVQGRSERGASVPADYAATPLVQMGWSINYARQMFSIEVSDDRLEFTRIEAYTG